MSGGLAQGLPWSPASEVASTIGFNAVIFGYPGCGKTTFAATAQDHPMGRDTFFWAVDSGIRSLADRTDVMTWPRKDPNTGQVVKPTWDGVMRISDGLKRPGKNPFRTLVFDDLTKGYRLCVDKVLGGTDRPMQIQDWGKANDMMINFIEEWADISRSTGINFIVNAHAIEVVEGADEQGNGGQMFIRIAATPGVAKAIPQLVDSIGYLSEKPRSPARKEPEYRLILHSTTKVVAKYRQPRSGPQLPDEIVNPTMGIILDHIDAINQARMDRIQPQGVLS
jgi:AAA domain